jgi:hypothetical protein
MATALWLARPYFVPRHIGTSDAMWYHYSLADAVTQFRAGVFPVYVGQSDYSFNGSIYPLRAAPYFQYLGGAIDFVTGHRLSFFALLHLTVVVSFVAGALAAYWSLAWIAPGRRWTACGLALLYILCPGVAGLFYAQDLYMSGMTLPWVPLAFAALVRSFEDGGLGPRAVLALSLAALWWAHSPIALWATFVAAAGQLVRLRLIEADRTDFARSGMAAAIFCVLAAYPIISVFLLRSPGEALVPYLMDRELLLQWVRESFPSSLRPINLGAPILSYLQLGYGLWLVLLASVAAWFFSPRNWAAGVLLAAAAFFLVLVFPVPWLTRALWLRFPETLVGMTLYWPMQRFYILIAGATVVSAQSLLARRTPGSLPGRLPVGAALLVAGLWSGHEAAKLIAKTHRQVDTVEDSKRWSLTENVAVQRHTYGLFARRPGYFNHGVVDPRMESRLLDPASGRVVASDYQYGQSRPAREEFRGTIDANPGILDLEPALKLEPGKRYLLTFQFAHADTTGLLQMIGHHFYREYMLPESGEAKAFGSGPATEKSVTLWTSLAAAETIRLCFIPTGAGAKPADYLPFARYRFQPIEPSLLPIRVESLIPYRATVESPVPALLESPRMFVPGYAATVNGKATAVLRSDEGLAAFPVPAGESQVVLRFTGPVALRLAFWMSASGWLIAVAVWGRWLAVRKHGRAGLGASSG